MKNFLMVFSFIAAAVVSQQARAQSGFFLEPMITYQDQTADVEYPNTFLSDSSGKVKGTGLGLRLGGHVIDTVFLAADLRYAEPKYEDSNFSANAKESNYGATLGLQMPIFGLRIWGTYIFDGMLDPKEDNNVDLKFKEAKGHRLGVGFHVAMFSLNVEYQNIKYDSTELEKLGAFSNVNAQDNISLTESGMVASLSFPISF